MLLSENEKTTGEEKEKQESSGCRFKQNRVWTSAAVQRCSDICMRIRKFLFAAEQTIRIYSFNNFSKTQTHKPPVPIKLWLIYHPSEHSHPGFYCLSWPPRSEQASVNVCHEGTDLWDASLFTSARHFQHDFLSLCPRVGAACTITPHLVVQGPFHADVTLGVAFTHSGWAGLTVLTHTSEEIPFLDLTFSEFSGGVAAASRADPRRCRTVWVFLAMGVMPGGVTPPHPHTLTQTRTHRHTHTLFLAVWGQLLRMQTFSCGVCVCVPRFWEAPYPVQSFCVTPAFPFWCASTPEDEWANWKLLLRLKHLGQLQLWGSSGACG